MRCTRRVAVPPAPILTGMAERDAAPLPQLTGECATLAAGVEERLKKMESGK